MNRGAARTQTLTRLGLNSAATDALLSTNVVNDQLMLSLHDIAQEWDWPWMEEVATVTFTAGVAAFPTGFRKTRAPGLSKDGLTIRQITMSDAMSMGDNSATAQIYTPGYYIEDNQFKTWPDDIADTATCHYYRDEPTIASDGTTSDSSSPVLPSRFHSTWVARTAWYCSQIRSDRDKAAMFDAIYQADIKRMRTETSFRSGPKRVRNAKDTIYAASWGT